MQSVKSNNRIELIEPRCLKDVMYSTIDRAILDGLCNLNISSIDTGNLTVIIVLYNTTLNLFNVPLINLGSY